MSIDTVVLICIMAILGYSAVGITEIYKAMPEYENNTLNRSGGSKRL